MLRVGRRRYENGKYVDPKFPGFTSILCLTKSSPYGSLSPYVLTDNGGRIMENLYQYSKIYRTIPATTERYSRYDNTIIWKHPAETHIDDCGNITPAYWKWRVKGFNNSYPVRYPVGFKHRHECMGAIMSRQDTTILDYISSRKTIYCSLYRRMVKKQPQFRKLKKRLMDGENLLIIEVDGPHQESMNYYQEKYAVADDFIVDHTILATKQNLQLLLDDSKHPFGHGYCLTAALANYTFE